MWVAPLVGAWIEITVIFSPAISFRSLPLWERGLKSQTPQTPQIPQTVAPLVGAWIEIIIKCGIFNVSGLSLPLWERGLKYRYGILFPYF